MLQSAVKHGEKLDIVYHLHPFDCFYYVEACYKWLYCQRQWELQSTLHEVYHQSGWGLTFMDWVFITVVKTFFFISISMEQFWFVVFFSNKGLVMLSCFVNLPDTMHGWSFDNIRDALSFVGWTICPSSSRWRTNPSNVFITLLLFLADIYKFWERDYFNEIRQ